MRADCTVLPYMSATHNCSLSCTTCCCFVTIVSYKLYFQTSVVQMQEMRCTLFLEIVGRGEKPVMFDGDVSAYGWDVI